MPNRQTASQFGMGVAVFECWRMRMMKAEFASCIWLALSLAGVDSAVESLSELTPGLFHVFLNPTKDGVVTLHHACRGPQVGEVVWVDVFRGGILHPRISKVPRRQQAPNLDRNISKHGEVLMPFVGVRGRCRAGDALCQLNACDRNSVQAVYP